MKGLTFAFWIFIFFDTLPCILYIHYTSQRVDHFQVVCKYSLFHRSQFTFAASDLEGD